MKNNQLLNCNLTKALFAQFLRVWQEFDRRMVDLPHLEFVWLEAETLELRRLEGDVANTLEEEERSCWPFRFEPFTFANNIKDVKSRRSEQTDMISA